MRVRRKEIAKSLPKSKNMNRVRVHLVLSDLLIIKTVLICGAYVLH